MNPRVLVIDDEDHFRSLVRLALETAGYEVGEAVDGASGLRALASGWDVVLLDQRMPGMDGLEVLRRIHELAPGARVVMATAYASIELAVDAMRFGATDFVRKPMVPETLRRSIAAALARPAGAAPAPRADRDVAPRPLVERVTMNGFRVLRSGGPTLPDERRPGPWRFLVRSPGGAEQEVTVSLEASFIREVERRSRRAFPPESPFWHSRAEHRLAAHLWETARPPDVPLRITDPTLEDLDAACRWDSEPDRDLTQS